MAAGRGRSPSRAFPPPRRGGFDDSTVRCCLFPRRPGPRPAFRHGLRADRRSDRVSRWLASRGSAAHRSASGRRGLENPRRYGHNEALPMRARRDANQGTAGDGCGASASATGQVRARPGACLGRVDGSIGETVARNRVVAARVRRSRRPEAARSGPGHGGATGRGHGVAARTDTGAVPTGPHAHGTRRPAAAVPGPSRASEWGRELPCSSPGRRLSAGRRPHSAQMPPSSPIGHAASCTGAPQSSMSGRPVRSGDDQRAGSPESGEAPSMALLPKTRADSRSSARRRAASPRIRVPARARWRGTHCPRVGSGRRWR
jgi:hypothetical protein